MYKSVERKETMQEDEIDALLKQAMDEERLCVSEELIQKTLRRINEESETKVVPMQKSYKKRKYVMRYAGVAAAAVLVLVVGGSILGSGGIGQKNFAMDAAPEQSMREAKNENGGGAGIQATTDGSKEAAEDFVADAVGDIWYTSSDSSAEAPQDAECAEEPESVGGTYLGATKQEISEELQTAFTFGGYTLTDSTAECWELVQRQSDWRKEIAEVLNGGGQKVTSLSENGTYEYFLARGTGEKIQLNSEEPLELIVCVETEKGTLWCFLGETVRVYTE